MKKAFLAFFFFAAMTTGSIPVETETDGLTRGGDIMFRHDTALKRIDVLFYDRLFTTFRYADTLEKPFFYPVYSPSGVAVTRGYPIDPKQGERTDHPHHTGIWFNHGNVNGLDFWNNSGAIPAERRCSYGRIVCIENSVSVNREEASLQTVSLWIDCSGRALLEEKTLYVFTVESQQVYSLKRFARLTALTDSVVFEDSKEGLLGIRVARPFEMPSARPDVFYDTLTGSGGKPVADSTGVNGCYRGSNGLTGAAVWGTRNRWVTLSAVSEGDSISIAMADHPDNHGFPSYWHARDYGLFSVNNLGVKSYDPRKAETRLVLKKDESVTFRHLLLVRSGGFLTDEGMEGYAEQFWDQHEEVSRESGSREPESE